MNFRNCQLVQNQLTDGAKREQTELANQSKRADFLTSGFVASLQTWIADLPILSPISAGYLYPIWYGFSSLLYMACGVALAGYFTLRRRMVAPSIALSVIFFAGALAFGISIGGFVVEWTSDGIISIRLNYLELKVWARWATANEGIASLCLSIGWATATLLLAGFHFAFRVPFTLALIALSVLATAYAVALLVYAIPQSLPGFLLLSSEGPFALLTLAFGLVFLAFAMLHDLSDPHRVTRRAASAFWLHAVAALSIMHTVAPTLLLQDTVSGKLLLFLFVLVMALFAIIVDRRIFIISGIGYFIALIFALVSVDLGFVLLLGLGPICLGLGAGWEALRGWLMRVLPDFPGKKVLPPWDSGMEDDDSAFSRTRPLARRIGANDIRMAVDAGIISDAQAASVTELVQLRNDERRRTSALEEPFELFRGFNEIFIVAGLLILAAGWIGLSLIVIEELPRFEIIEFPVGHGHGEYWVLGIFAVIGMLVTVRLASYFTSDRRMIAPSIALVVIFTIGAMAMGFSIYLVMEDTFRIEVRTGFWVFPTLLLSWYYSLFRVPFTMALIAFGIFASAYELLDLGGRWPRIRATFSSFRAKSLSPLSQSFSA